MYKKLVKNFFFKLGYEIKKIPNFYTFINIYDSYEKAYLASNNSVKYVTKEHQQSFKLSDLENLEVADRFNIFPVFCAISFNEINEDKLNFLEVGGGHNPIFLYILKSTGKKYKFSILEEKNFKISIPKKYHNYLNYIYHLKHINFKNLTAVIFSGSIQFMENYKHVLEKLFYNRVKYIFITETIFTLKSKDIFTLQNNMESVRFPNIFLSLYKLNKLLYKNNYRLIYETTRKIGAYKHNILKKKDFFVKDLIYKLD